MEWLVWIDMLGYATLGVGVLVLIWGLVRGIVPVTALGLLIAGLLIELLIWLIT